MKKEEWTLSNEINRKLYVTSKDGTVCSINVDTDDVNLLKKIDANIKLIIAAPKMLETLIEARTMIFNKSFLLKLNAVIEEAIK